MNQSTNQKTFICLAVVIVCLFLGSMIFWRSSGESDQQVTAYQRFWVNEGLPQIDQAEVVDPGKTGQTPEQGVDVRLLTSHSVSDTGEFYESQFVAQGWHPQATRPVSGDHYVGEFRNGRRVIRIFARPAQSSRRGTAIQIVYRQQAPANSALIGQVARRRTEAHQEGRVDFE